MAQTSGPSEACSHPRPVPDTEWETRYRRWHSTPTAERHGEPPLPLLCPDCGRGVSRGGAVERPAAVVVAAL